MVLLIIGGSRGIGKEIVLRAIQKSCNVAFTYRSQQELASKKLEEAHALEPTSQCCAYPLDVCNVNDLDNVIGRVVADFGTFDAVVCNAGINKDNLMFSMRNDEWKEVIDTNLTGSFYTIRRVLPIFFS